MVLKHASLQIGRPGQLLGLLSFIVLGSFAGLLIWHNCLAEYRFLGLDLPDMKGKWLFTMGILAAICGWIVSAAITVRNSIKQHTINTLLQSRLSATYMEHAKCINKELFSPGQGNEPVQVSFLHHPDHVEVLRSVDYVLNYLEFLSVGIRHGDLDEKVLRHTMRGIVIRLYEKVRLYMWEMRGDDGVYVARPQQLEHLTWLYLRWKTDKLKEEDEIVKKPVTSRRGKLPESRMDE